MRIYGRNFAQLMLYRAELAPMNRAYLLSCFGAALFLGAVLGWFMRGSGRAGLPGPVVSAGPSVSANSAKQGSTVGFKTGESRSAQAQPEATRLTVDLISALQDGTLTAEFRGNARQRLRMMATNRATQAVRLSVPAGQVFESANGLVVVLRARIIDFRPGETRLEEFSTVATASTNRVADATFVLSTASQPKLQALLEFLTDHPEVSTPAAQTAALAILENLPAGAFAKFAEVGNDLPEQWDTTGFKVETVDIIQALIVLRGLGMPDEQLAITVDPQTKIEAMIDPLAHAVAMRYYGIQREAEWAYWKHELLEGDPSTRHYALHGIARYFPDVALPMLPRWVRETRTSQVFRMTAIQALAETQRTEALPILRELEHELGPDTELGKAASQAAGYLNTVLNKPQSEGQKAVVFRVGKALSPL